MKFKTLIAVAVAGAFTVPFAALAQGTGGTTTAPSATHPQGNPPAAAPAGSQTSGSGATGEGNASWTKLDKNKDGYISKAEAKGDPELSKNFDKWDLNNDGKLNRAEYLAAMAKEDAVKAKDKISEKISGDKSSSGGSSKPAK